MKVLLLSGGFDSSALAAMCQPDLCLTLDYGQRPAAGEIAASRAIAEALNLHHETLSLDLSSIGTGALAGKAQVEGARAEEFWPYRNQMLVTVASMALIGRGLQEIIIGTVKTDMHADGRPEFISGLNALMFMQEGRVQVSAPAQDWTTLELMQKSGFPQDLIGLTFSCHVAEYACGMCNGCTKHNNTIGQLVDQGAT